MAASHPPSTSRARISGTLTFEAGETARTIDVVVNGDRTGEPNDTFLVNLGLAAGGAIVADTQGVGTVVDDEPRVASNSVTRGEGNSGLAPLTFTVSLSAASTAAVSLNFATQVRAAPRGGEDLERDIRRVES